MGLDMYLNAKRYLSSHDPKEREIAKSIKDFFPELKASDDDKITYITMEAGYWRKANAVHNWFVNNVQGGEDDCGYYYVNRNHLESLQAVCQQVIADPTKAEELLPTAEGFFFGSTEYDEWYIRDLQCTVDMISKALKLPIDWDFEYHSSW